MTLVKSDRTIGIWTMTFVAIGFGLLTIKSGGAVLFIDSPARIAAGHYVPFVLWFNFFAGFSYLIAGAGLFMKKLWAAWMAIFIAAATTLVFLLLGLHILNDGLYEFRTIVAMSLRTGIWTIIALVSYRKFIYQK